jgi:hypothetical protein
MEHFISKDADEDRDNLSKESRLVEFIASSVTREYLVGHA